MNEATNNGGMMTVETLASTVDKLDYRVRGHVAALTARLNKLSVRGSDQAIVPTVVTPAIDAEAVRAIVRDEVAKAQPTVTMVSVNGSEPRKVAGGKRVHKAFEQVLRLLMAGVPVMLVGPAGSGKTTLAEHVAEAMSDVTGGRFSFNSMSEGVTESKILGRVLPPSFEFEFAPFAKTYRDGGVHLFDELDASDPNVLVSINAAIANRKLSIPDADMVIDQHEHAYIIAACNTYGFGATRQYSGRNKLDAATLDRYACSCVEVDYDRDLERDIAVGICGDDHAATLLAWAWQVRDRINAVKTERLMSMRTVINSAKKLAGGFTMDECKAAYFQSWSADERRAVGV